MRYCVNVPNFDYQYPDTVAGLAEADLFFPRVSYSGFWALNDVLNRSSLIV